MQLVDALPEQRLAQALVVALTTFEHALRLDVAAELIEYAQAQQLDAVERQKTGELLSELRRLEHRRVA